MRFLDSSWIGDRRAFSRQQLNRSRPGLCCVDKDGKEDCGVCSEVLGARSVADRSGEGISEGLCGFLISSDRIFNSLLAAGNKAARKKNLLSM
jgi:hypothetical protein